MPSFSCVRLFPTDKKSLPSGERRIQDRINKIRMSISLEGKNRIPKSPKAHILVLWNQNMGLFIIFILRPYYALGIQTVISPFSRLAQAK